METVSHSPTPTPPCASLEKKKENWKVVPATAGIRGRIKNHKCGFKGFFRFCFFPLAGLSPCLLFIFFLLAQGVADSGRWAQPGPLPVWGNKVLSGHSRVRPLARGPRPLRTVAAISL